MITGCAHLRVIRHHGRERDRDQVSGQQLVEFGSELDRGENVNHPRSIVSVSTKMFSCRTPHFTRLRRGRWNRSTHAFGVDDIARCISCPAANRGSARPKRKSYTL